MQKKDSILFYNKKNLFLRICPVFLLFSLSWNAYAQGDAILEIKGKTSELVRKKGLGLNVGVSSVDMKEDPMEGISILVKKNGKTILNISSEKKGAYSFQVPVSILDAKNSFTAYFTKSGMAPKEVEINAFIPTDEFMKYKLAKYEFELDIALLYTTVTDIELDKPSIIIKWDKTKEHKFVIDPSHAGRMRGEEQKMVANTDLYFTTLAKKMKRKDDAQAKKDAAAEAKLKAEEEAKKKDTEAANKLASAKAKEEADKLLRAQEEGRLAELAKKRAADSLANIALRKKTESNVDANASIEIKTKVKTIKPEVFDNKDSYNAAETFSINIARKSINLDREKRGKEKGKNLSTKYETFNILTSLLDVVDEDDKKNKQR